jgi:hypothetical protein
MARQAKGETPEATKKLLDLKHGTYIEAQLQAGQSPWVLAEALAADTQEVTKDVEKRDRQGKVTGMDEVTIGPLRVAGEQLLEWYPNSCAIGEPPSGWEKPA